VLVPAGLLGLDDVQDLLVLLMAGGALLKTNNPSILIAREEGWR